MLALRWRVNGAGGGALRGINRWGRVGRAGRERGGGSESPG